MVDFHQWSTRDVSAQMVCLNDEATIRRSLQSLIANNVGEIVVVDGGSSDNTIGEINDLPVTILRSETGLRTQTLVANAAMNLPFCFVGEADQLFEPDFVDRLLKELLASGHRGLQAAKTFSSSRTFLERGHSLFLDIHQGAPGARDFISGPQIWRTEDFVEVIALTSGNQGYSFDTEIAETIARLGFTVGVGLTSTEEIGAVNFTNFKQRLQNYGAGDFAFYQSNRTEWKMARKVQSLTHIFRRYGLNYPWRAFVAGRGLIGIPYFWTVCIFRYCYWFRALLDHRLRQSL